MTSDRLLIPELERSFDLRSFPHPVGRLEHIETHISHIVFAGDHVYKLRKPVDLGFLDFRDGEERRRLCEAEVALNAPLAPGVHLGVVPVTVRPDGALEIGGAGEVLEYATQMRRLPRHRMMDVLLEDGEIENEAVDRLCRTLAAFHEQARRGPDVDRWGTPECIRENAWGNLQALREFVGVPGDESSRGPTLLGPKTLALLEGWTESELNRCEETFRRRIEKGFVRDGHGDLHAENVCYPKDRPVIYDRIEFSERFRCGDVACDLAFLAMDLDFRSFRGVSGYLVKRYAEITGDESLRDLIPFYKSYRALVRAKVGALMATELATRGEVEAAARGARKAMRYIHLAASYALPPTLILTCGLPGSGKSVFSHAVHESFEAVELRSDRIRKTMFGMRATDRVPADRKGEVYGDAAGDRVYHALRDRARQALQGGRSAIVDAAFPRAEQRRPLVELAAELGAPLALAEIHCPEDVVRARLAARIHDAREVSDAGVEVFEGMRRQYEAPTPAEAPVVAIDGMAHGRLQVAALIESLAAEARDR